MRLSFGQALTTFFIDATRKARRRVIAGAIVAASLVAAAIEGTSAARHALEPSLGPVGARLVLAGAFVLIGTGAVLTLLWAERRAEQRDAARRPYADGDARAAILAEAISLGYALGRDFMKASPDGQAASAEDEAFDPSADRPASSPGAGQTRPAA